MEYCEPYRSCSLLGALRSFANLQNVICLIHGPTGCSFYARNSIIRLNGYYSARERIRMPMIFCTDITEDDVIFGGINRLQNAIIELIDKYNPDGVVVFNCCVSEIIGDDINSLVLELSEKYHKKIVPVHSAGFKGDHKVGMRMAADVLMEYFFLPEASKNPGRVNILGDYDYFNRSTQEITRVLKKIGINEIYHIPGTSSLEQLEHAPDACLNIITCQNASRYLAELMKEKYGIEYIGDNYGFYGIEDAFCSYKQIYEFFNIDQTELIAEKAEYEELLKPYKENLCDKKAIIVAGTRRAMGYATMLKELGVEIQFIFSETDEHYMGKETFLKYSEQVMCNENPEMLFKLIDEKKPDYVFSTLPELVAPNKYVLRRDEDYAGFSGMLDFAKCLLSLAGKDEPVFTRMEN